jgi:hypothetical protein
VRKAEESCRFIVAVRGLLNSPRAGRYGGRLSGSTSTPPTPGDRHRYDRRSEALDEIEAIAAVDGVQRIFIGRGDLTVALAHRRWTLPRSSMWSSARRRGAGRRQAACMMAASGGSGLVPGARRHELHRLIDQVSRQAAGRVLSDFAHRIRKTMRTDP